LALIVQHASGGTLDSGAKSVSTMDPHLLLTIFIPPLIFESGFNINYHMFLQLLSQAMLLAGPGVILSVALTSVYARFVLHSGWDWSLCLTYGSIVSATDPVAVVALLHELGAPENLGTLIEGESLLNDGTAYVFFLVFKEVADGADFELDTSVLKFLKMAIGGPLVGFAFGYLMKKILKLNFYTGDLMFERVILLVSPYAVFYTAEVPCEVSGVLATVVFSVYLANQSHFHIIDLHTVHMIWGTVGWICNALIFMIAGVLVGAHYPFVSQTISGFEIMGYTLLNWIFLMIVRAITMTCAYPFLAGMGYGMDHKRAFVSVWGGLRGAIALAMAVMVEDDELIAESDRDSIFLYVSSTVLLTLCVNGTLTGPLLSYFEFDKKALPRIALAKVAQQSIIEYEKTIKYNMEHEMEEYAFANFAGISEDMLDFDAQHNLFGTASSDDSIEVDEVVKEQFLCAFVAALDAFRLDAKVDPAALHILNETAEMLRDPEHAPSSCHCCISEWWEKLLLPRVMKLTHCEDEYYMQMLNFVSGFPLCGCIASRIYNRKRMNDRQVAIEVAKGFRRTIRHVWEMMEATGHVHHDPNLGMSQHLVDRKEELKMELAELNERLEEIRNSTTTPENIARTHSCRAVHDKNIDSLQELKTLSVSNDEKAHEYLLGQEQEDQHEAGKIGFMCCTIVETNRAKQRIIMKMLDKATELTHEGMLTEEDHHIIREQLIAQRRMAHNERYRLVDQAHMELLAKKYDLKGARDRKLTRESLLQSRQDANTLEEIELEAQDSKMESAATVVDVAPNVPAFTRMRTMPIMKQELRFRTKGTVEEYMWQDNLHKRVKPIPEFHRTTSSLGARVGGGLVE